MEDYNTKPVELSNVEKLIVKQAFVSAVADDTKTKDPSNSRGRLDAMMEESYYSNPLAGRSFDLKLLGEKVGSYTLTVSKGKPAKTERTLEITDNDAFMAWAEANGYVEKVADMDAILADFMEGGEIPEGCEPGEIVIPEVVGGKVTRSKMRIDSTKVADVLGPRLGTVVHGLLEGGEE